MPSTEPPASAPKAGDDSIAVGSLAGFWPTAPDPTKLLNINGTGHAINAVLTIDAGPQNAKDRLTIDDTADAISDVGFLTSTEVQGIFGTLPSTASTPNTADKVVYANLESLVISLGSGDDLFTIKSTHANPSTTELDDGLQGERRPPNVETIAGPTTVLTGQGDDLVRVGSTTGAATRRPRTTCSPPAYAGLHQQRPAHPRGRRRQRHPPRLRQRRFHRQCAAPWRRDEPDRLRHVGPGDRVHRGREREPVPGDRPVTRAVHRLDDRRTAASSSACGRDDPGRHGRQRKQRRQHQHWSPA